MKSSEFLKENPSKYPNFCEKMSLGISSPKKSLEGFVSNSILYRFFWEISRSIPKEIPKKSLGRKSVHISGIISYEKIEEILEGIHFYNDAWNNFLKHP